MVIMLYLGIIWIVYGILGVLALKINIPKRFKNQEWTKEYTKKRCLVWVMLGIFWLSFWFNFKDNQLQSHFVILGIVVSSIPSIILAYKINKDYKFKLKSK